MIGLTNTFNSSRETMEYSHAICIWCWYGSWFTLRWHSPKIIYTIPRNLPGLRPLSYWMKSFVAPPIKNSGGGSFDEIWSGLWITIAKTYPNGSIPKTTFSKLLWNIDGNRMFVTTWTRKGTANLFQFFCQKNFFEKSPVEKIFIPFNHTYWSGRLITIT